MIVKIGEKDLVILSSLWFGLKYISSCILIILWEGKEVVMMIIIVNYDYVFNDIIKFLYLEVNNYFRFLKRFEILLLVMEEIFLCFVRL